MRLSYAGLIKLLKNGELQLLQFFEGLMNRIQKIKKQLVRTRERFMLSVVSFDQKSRILRPNNKNKKREKTDKSMRIFPILPDEKFQSSFCNEGTHVKRIEIRHRGEGNSERKLGIKNLNDKISRRISHEKINPSCFQSINNSSLIPSFRINCLSLKKFSENHKPTKRLHQSLRKHQSQYSLRSKIDRLEKLTTAELENTIVKNGIDEKALNIQINIKPQGKIMMRRKISIAPWTGEQEFQKLI